MGIFETVLHEHLQIIERKKEITMKSLKVAIIGAGSTYTPELIDGFLQRLNSLSLGSLYFMDINLPKTRIVASLCQRMLDDKGVTAPIIITDNLELAIEGADYVLGQVRVGMLEARIRDEKIPLKYNLLGQETTGAGGFMKALRTIPVIMNVAKTMERLAPDAWLINFSNPSGIIAETILNHSSVKMMGLCNGPIGMIREAKNKLPEDTKEFDYDFVGLNHLCWLTGIYADGVEILQKHLGRADSSQIGATSFKNIPESPYSPELLQVMKGIPIGYLNYYYFRDESVKKCQNAEKTRGEVCVGIEDELLRLYQDTSIKEKPDVLNQRGGALYSEAAVSLIDAIENDKNEVHVVDVKNNGTYPFLAYDDVVETKCVINKDGATPIPLRNYHNTHITGLVQAVKAYEKLTVKAGLEGDRTAALSALLVHPLIGDYNRAKPLLDEMLEANKMYLPQFFK